MEKLTESLHVIFNIKISTFSESQFVTFFNESLSMNFVAPTSRLASVIRNELFHEFIFKSNDTIGISYLALTENSRFIEVKEFARIIIRASIFTDKSKILNILNSWKCNLPVKFRRKAKLSGIFAEKNLGPKSGIDILNDSKKTVETNGIFLTIYLKTAQSVKFL